MILNLTFMYVADNTREILLDGVHVAYLEWHEGENDMAVMKCVPARGPSRDRYVFVQEWYDMDDEIRIAMVHDFIRDTLFQRPTCPMRP